MANLRYYISLFIRWLPYFLIVATVISAVSVIVAVSLPPSYVSRMQLIVESPQIPTSLASSTVRTPALEQLQIMQQRLLTRANLLAIARDEDVLPNAPRMNPDEIVQAMRARTNIQTTTGRNEVTLMTVRFEATNPQKAASVLNRYLTLILREDAQFRRGRAGETLAFFTRERSRLSEELEKRNERIRDFKEANSGALPSSLDFRLREQSSLQDRIARIRREISSLQTQRKQLVRRFEQTGAFASQGSAASLTPAGKQLQNLRKQLNEALVVFSPQNPKVKMLKARIANAEKRMNNQAAAPEGDEAADTGKSPRRTRLDIQLTQIDTRISVLENQRTEIEEKLAKLEKAIAATPANSIKLDELQREYRNIEKQYNQAVSRLSQARTGEQIEERSRGQRISVIDQPAVPSEPTKPNRLLIAGGGSFVGILAGLGLIVLFEVLNGSARRPEDLVNRFGISPLTSIPYIRTRREMVLSRGLKLGAILIILVGVPAAIYAVHVYYQPLDLIADRIMNKMGVRW